MATPLVQATELPPPRPLLKWAGGKSQLLPELIARMPKRFNNYIEPFIGGGALYFAVRPRQGVIADSNPELVNLYKAVADDVESVIEALSEYSNDEKLFYKSRQVDWAALSSSEAAARTIFLNRTCFNGLYRVNKRGGFNVPFGKYKNPKILDETNLRSAAALLRDCSIVCGDFLSVLREHARAGDFVFLDPPYLPISAYSDFKRYTKEQFYEEDHQRLATEVQRLNSLGCYVLLTNSNHPLVHEQYEAFSIEVVSTKRSINSRASGRSGEDVIVTAAPQSGVRLVAASSPLPDQMQHFPATRFMGSKHKLLQEIHDLTKQFRFDTAIDLFSGTGIVSYLFKAQGKAVVSNDLMAMASTISKALIANDCVRLSPSNIETLVDDSGPVDDFVRKTFKGLYFSDSDNRFIDVVRSNLERLPSSTHRALGRSALIRACIKRRPRGIFTYTGDRYDDGRKDLKKSLLEHFVQAVVDLNAAVFSTGAKSNSRLGDAMTLVARPESCLVYIDPPYFTPGSDNDYVRRYHFVEGLARDWRGVEIQEHTSTKKFRAYPTPFSTRIGAASAFDRLFQRFAASTLVVSYSSNSLPGLEEMTSLLARHKRYVEVIPLKYRYSFGNQAKSISTARNSVLEYLFVGYD